MAGDEIRGEVGDESQNAIFGKQNRQTSNAGGGGNATINLGAGDVQGIYYALNGINNEMVRVNVRLDGHGDRIGRLEAGRPIEMSTQTAWLLAIIVILIAALVWNLLSTARGGDPAPLVPTAQALTVAVVLAKAALWI